MSVTTRMMGRNKNCKCGQCDCLGIVPIKVQRKQEKITSLQFEKVANGNNTYNNNNNNSESE